MVEEIVSFAGKHTVLVYKDGTCESLGSVMSSGQPNSKPIVNEETDQITNIACFTTPDGKVMLTYFVRNTLTGDMEFVYFFLDDEMLTAVGDIRKIKIGRRGSTLSGFGVVEGVLYPSVMTICTLFIYGLMSSSSF